MNLNRINTNGSSCNGIKNDLSICCYVGIPSASVTSIIDIDWNGELVHQSVLNTLRPNEHSFILGTDPLPVGYLWDSVNHVLYFPPNKIIHNNQFATWTAPTVIDSCGAYIWNAEPLCVTYECKNCYEVNGISISQGGNNGGNWNSVDW